MGKYAKLREKILSGSADEDIPFSSLRQLLIRIGFDEAVITYSRIIALLKSLICNQEAIQLKHTQIKQIRNILLKYRLGESNVDKI